MIPLHGSVGEVAVKARLSATSSSGVRTVGAVEEVLGDEEARGLDDGETDKESLTKANSKRCSGKTDYLKGSRDIKKI